MVSDSLFLPIDVRVGKQFFFFYNVPNVRGDIFVFFSPSISSIFSFSILDRSMKGKVSDDVNEFLSFRFGERTRVTRLRFAG